MARAQDLEVGAEYPVRSGAYEGHRVVVQSNVPRPDGSVNQRKIRVRDTATGKSVYLLPRVIMSPEQEEEADSSTASRMLIHTAPITASGLRELAKLRTTGEGPMALITLIGDWSPDDLKTLRAVFGEDEV